MRKHIVFDLGAVLFSWHPRQMLMREVPHLAPDEQRAAHWEAEIFQNYTGDWGEFDRGTVSVPTLVQRIAHRTGLAAADVLWICVRTWQVRSSQNQDTNARAFAKH